MGDVIDLDSRRPEVPSDIRLVDEVAEMAGWVTRRDDGSVVVEWHDSDAGMDRGFVMTAKQAREFGAAVSTAADERWSRRIKAAIILLEPVREMYARHGSALDVARCDAELAELREELGKAGG